ncbi:MAG: PRC-barrel domain-containing protein [Chloroflexi bacterium]|nr:PRC-barrel domain-containing protein [Chloroflexota bacterium]
MAVLSVERLKGMDVYDREGQRVGNIRDVVLDAQEGCVHYALVGTGGVLSALGIEDKLFAVPCDRITIGEDRVRLEASRDILKEAPSFSPYQPPQFNREYERKLCDFWQITPYWEQPGYRVQERRVGDLMTRDVAAVHADALIGEAAEILARAGGMAVPVVDEQGRYLGLITAQNLAEVTLGQGKITERRHEEARSQVEEERIRPKAPEIASEREEWEGRSKAA